MSPLNRVASSRPPQRKKPAQRAYRGLAGSALAMVRTSAGPKKPRTVRQSVTELVQKAQREHDTLEYLRYLDRAPDDDDPILKSTRPRSGGSVCFQRYAFRLGSSGNRNARWDRGLTPQIYESMSNHGSVRELELDENNRAGSPDTHALSKVANKTESDFDPKAKATSPNEPATIGTVAQSMPKAFSTGVLSTRFDFTNPPRRPKPDTAWVFDEQRFKYFITRKILDDAVAAYEKDSRDPELVRLVARALKAYIALYSHFRIGLSDKGFLEDEELEHQHFWTSTNALKKYRSRLLQEGLALFGTPADEKEAPEGYDPVRVARVWPIFHKVFRTL